MLNSFFNEGLCSENEDLSTVNFSDFLTTSFLRANMFPGEKEDRVFFEPSFQRIREAINHPPFCEQIRNCKCVEVLLKEREDLQHAKPNGAIAHKAINVRATLEAIASGIKRTHGEDLTFKELEIVDPERAESSLSYLLQGRSLRFSFGSQDFKWVEIDET